MSKKLTEAHMSLLDLHKRNRARCAGETGLGYLVAGKRAKATFLAGKCIYKSSLHIYLFPSKSNGQALKNKEIGLIELNMQVISEISSI